ncbi:ABC transporter substrate-binding protein [Flavobacterium covae]|uniref:ABC transporter substrate-binding protein n=1 Tax=Flavobacterium covae TaxID=2906076 RepID=A0ABW8PF24_9FLAO|nr:MULTISPECIES: ABC transporter substrate-binding protein [Flavobacterium]OWP82475.1 ABC transporter substrate-binding protein [Flavobacterium covae]POR22500.1 ABC transporter substrate-binding protein [Flavobacterium columnare]
MIKLLQYIFFVLFCSLTIQCKKNEATRTFAPQRNNVLTDATAFTLNEYENYSVIKVTTPWPNAQKPFTYVLTKSNKNIPDSLKQYLQIPVPLKNLVVTSTTNIPFLEILGVENKLVGFPHTDYISSDKTRKLIDSGRIKNLGENEKINIEQLISLAPNALVAFGVDGNNPTLNTIEKAGIPVLIQADWMEQTPLGKAEWIKFFGALVGKEKEAKNYFDQVKKNYLNALEIVKTIQQKPTILYGTMYQDQWYIPKGDSWKSTYIQDAGGNYLWKDVKGTGSIPLSFEQVFEKGQNALIWIATGDITNWNEFGKSNIHYSQFKAYQNKKVYTFEGKKGKKGGTLFFEFSPSQPDKVLKDYIKIIHPELLPNYPFTFVTPIQ